MLTVYVDTLDTPIGPVRVASTGAGLCCVAMPGETEKEMHRWIEERLGAARIAAGTGRNDLVLAELEAYFAGRLDAFSVPLDLRGTPFQQRVWAELRRIPYGMTRSYGEVARAIGRPGAARAVGAANAANPVPIVVPCHRVVASDGTLGGYSGGGIAVKRYLLDLESRRRPGRAAPFCGFGSAVR